MELPARAWLEPLGLNEPVDGGRCVFIDQERAGYLATKHLIEENRHRIALLNGPREAYWASRRASVDTDVR